MSGILTECLNASYDSSDYILPFFWQHGEAHGELKNEMDAMYNLGIRAFCVESRTHMQFCEDKWWEDFGFILDYAAQKGMRVWLLDDKHFPTGYACGGIEKRPELRQKTLSCVMRDFMGGRECAFIAPALNEGESFFKIIACDVKGDMSVENPVDISEDIKDGILRLGLSAGHKRIFYFISSQSRTARPEYIDMINPESVKVLIKEVYEPHFEHFGKYFGTVFMGFFSDEPSFGNTSGNPGYPLGDARQHTLPWREDLPGRISAFMGIDEDEFWKALPCLFNDGEEDITRRVRFAYMDTVSKLYGECFTDALGNWCRERNVSYIGHVIEDNNGDLRLSSNAAHYFRALDGQDMAGIDIVLTQFVEGILDEDYMGCINYSNGPYMQTAFFRYELAKLASSHAHIDPKKQSRAMCEIFGAFGWGEGVPLMKKMADHMLVSGINRFVPHAFSAKEDDPDCPPHFYNKGKYPQHKYFGRLTEYMTRVSHILSRGVHAADCLLYYSTAPWSGEKDAAFNDLYARELLRAGLDFDFVSEDYILACEADCGRVRLNKETYSCIFIPSAKIMDGKAFDKLTALAKAGVKIYCFTQMPETDETGRNLKECFEFKALEPSADQILAVCSPGFKTSKNHPHLRRYLSLYPDGRVCMLLNEDENETIELCVRDFSTDSVIYDAMDNKLLKPEVKEEGIFISLTPGEAVILAEHPLESASAPFAPKTREIQEISAESCLKQYKTDIKAPWTEVKDGECALVDAACFAYEFEAKKATRAYISFDGVGEIATVFINGSKAAETVCAPYRADVSGLLTEEANFVRVEVVNNVGYAKKDGLTEYLALPLPGLTGKIHIGEPV